LPTLSVPIDEACTVEIARGRESFGRRRVRN